MSLKDFLRYSNSIGNLTLIPFKVMFHGGVVRPFNKSRGTCKQTRDMWDRSLALLLDDNNFGKELFIEYVDYFYHYDYVKDYEPINLFTGSLDKNSNPLPNLPEYCDEYFRNTGDKIKTRGITMITILMLKKLNFLKKL